MSELTKEIIDENFELFKKGKALSHPLFELGTKFKLRCIHYLYNKTPEAKKKRKEWAENNEEEIKAYRQSKKYKATVKKYRENNKEKVKEWNKKHRQSKKGKKRIKEYYEKEKIKRKKEKLKSIVNKIKEMKK